MCNPKNYYYSRPIYAIQYNIYIYKINKHVSWIEVVKNMRDVVKSIDWGLQTEDSNPSSTSIVKISIMLHFAMNFWIKHQPFSVMIEKKKTFQIQLPCGLLQIYKITKSIINSSPSHYKQSSLRYYWILMSSVKK